MWDVQPSVCVCSTAFYKHLCKCSMTREADSQRTASARTRKHSIGGRASTTNAGNRKDKAQWLKCLFVLSFTLNCVKFTSPRFPASSPLRFIHMFIIWDFLFFKGLWQVLFIRKGYFPTLPSRRPLRSLFRLLRSSEPAEQNGSDTLKIKHGFDGISQMFRFQSLVKGKTTKHSRNENRSHRIQSLMICVETVSRRKTDLSVWFKDHKWCFCLEGKVL